MIFTCPVFRKNCDFLSCRQFWNRALRQRQEALDKVNRYYFWLFNGREALNDNELFIYYAENGGARDFYAREHNGQN